MLTFFLLLFLLILIEILTFMTMKMQKAHEMTHAVSQNSLSIQCLPGSVKNLTPWTEVSLKYLGIMPVCGIEDVFVYFLM